MGSLWSCRLLPCDPGRGRQIDALADPAGADAPGSPTVRPPPGVRLRSSGGSASATDDPGIGTWRCAGGDRRRRPAHVFEDHLRLLLRLDLRRRRRRSERRRQFDLGRLVDRGFDLGRLGHGARAAWARASAAGTAPAAAPSAAWWTARLGDLDARAAAARLAVELLVDLALVGRLLGEFGERLDQRSDDARAPRRRGGGASTGSRRQQRVTMIGDMAAATDSIAAATVRARDAGSPHSVRRCKSASAGGGPTVSIRLPGICETTSECSSILSRIARATPRV